MMDCDSRQEMLTRALEHLRSAIQLLDVSAAPKQIAAHIDLSACQLADLIGTAGSTSPCLAGDPVPQVV
jgi:hypothetical protein